MAASQEPFIRAEQNIEHADQISGLQHRANISAVAGSSGENSGQTVLALNERTEPHKHTTTPKANTTMTVAAPRTTPDNIHTVKLSRRFVLTSRSQIIRFITVLSESLLILGYGRCGRFDAVTLRTIRLTEQRYISKLHFHLGANSMTTVNRWCVAVAPAYSYCVHLINVSHSDQLSFDRQIQTDGICRLITYNNGTLIGLYNTLESNTIQIRDMAGFVVKSFACDFSSFILDSLAVSPDLKYIYVSGSEHVIRMTVGGKVVNVIDTTYSGGLNNIAVGGDGTVYAFDRSQTKICQINPTNGAVTELAKVVAEVVGLGSTDRHWFIVTFKDKLYVGARDGNIIEYDIVKGLW